MRNNKRQTVIIVVGVLALLWLGFRVFRSSPQAENTSTAAAVEQKTAAALAEGAAAVAGKGGSVLVVMPLSQRADQTPEPVAAFRKAAEKKGLIIAAEICWPPTPREEERKDSMAFMHYLVAQGSLTADWLADEAAKHPGITVVVSLVGEPVVGEGNEDACRGRFPPVLCAARDSARTAALIRAGVVRMALMPAGNPVKHNLGGKLFDECFREVTAETLGDWQKEQPRR